MLELIIFTLLHSLTARCRERIHCKVSGGAHSNRSHGRSENIVWGRYELMGWSQPCQHPTALSATPFVFLPLHPFSNDLSLVCLFRVMRNPVSSSSEQRSGNHPAALRWHIGKIQWDRGSPCSTPCPEIEHPFPGKFGHVQNALTSKINLMIELSSAYWLN